MSLDSLPWLCYTYCMDEINTTSSLSPRDYGMAIRTLNVKDLAMETQTNYWCWKNLQCQEIDYKERYLVCVARQLQRRHHDNI